MATDPSIAGDVWKRRMRANVQRGLAQSALGLGQWARADRAASQAVHEFVLSGGDDAKNPMLAEEAIKDRLDLVRIQWQRGDASAEHAGLAEIEAAAARLPPVDPDRAEWHVRGRGNLLWLRAQLRPLTPALLTELQAYVAALPYFERAGRMLTGSARYAAVDVALALGDALALTGQPVPHWQQATERTRAAAQAGVQAAINRRALAQVRLGLTGVAGATAEARASADRLQATDWRHPDLADLRRRLGLPALLLASSQLP